MEMVSRSLSYPMLLRIGCSGATSLVWEENQPVPAPAAVTGSRCRELLPQPKVSRLIVHSSAAAMAQRSRVWKKVTGFKELKEALWAAHLPSTARMMESAAQNFAPHRTQAQNEPR